jgi:hypothetical protein
MAAGALRFFKGAEGPWYRYLGMVRRTVVVPGCNCDDLPAAVHFPVVLLSLEMGRRMVPYPTCDPTGFTQQDTIGDRCPGSDALVTLLCEWLTGQDPPL